jgi:hypothetical protein
VIEEETQHFPRRVRPARIGVGAGGTAARPGVAGTMNVPVLGDRPAAPVGNDGASVGMPVRDPSAKHLRCRTRRFGGLLENSAAVVRMLSLSFRQSIRAKHSPPPAKKYSAFSLPISSIVSRQSAEKPGVTTAIRLMPWAASVFIVSSV